MNKLFALLLFLFISTSYSQDILWEKSYGGIYSDYLFDVHLKADYGFILTGSSLSNKLEVKNDDNSGDLDYWIWKITEEGELDL